MREITWYIAVQLRNPDAAEKMVESFEEAFAKLEKNPERHALVADEPWRSEGVRKVKVKHFLVYFWIDVEHAAVQISGIAYGKRDQKKFLKQIKPTDK